MSNDTLHKILNQSKVGNFRRRQMIFLYPRRIVKHNFTAIQWCHDNLSLSAVDGEFVCTCSDVLIKIHHRLRIRRETHDYHGRILKSIIAVKRVYERADFRHITK